MKANIVFCDTNHFAVRGGAFRSISFKLFSELYMHGIDLESKKSLLSSRVL